MSAKMNRNAAAIACALALALALAATGAAAVRTAPRSVGTATAEPDADAVVRSLHEADPLALFESFQRTHGKVRAVKGQSYALSVQHIDSAGARQFQLTIVEASGLPA